MAFSKGDCVKYIGPDKNYPVDSNLAERYLDRKEVYTIERVGACGPYALELKLVGIPAPLVACLFRRLEH